MTAPAWRRRVVRYLLTTISVGIAVFWIWAFFFPQSKQSVAKLVDEQWSQRAQGLCREANVARDELADLRRIDDVGEGALTARADIIDRATDIIERMVDDVTAATPTGPDDVVIMNTWAEYYRQWIADRRIYADVLREGRNPPFAESMVDGSPISEYLNDFTIANRMKACSAPTDLAV
ncbi:MAG: hypothetical protein ACO3SP_05275 [Ilumatobacteraceae bacterium]